MMTSDSVKAGHTLSAGISAGERRKGSASRRVVSDTASKGDMRKDLLQRTRLPTPARGFSDGHAMHKAESRRVTPSPREATKSPFMIGHGSAPPGLERTRPDRSPFRSAKIDKKAELQQAINPRPKTLPERTAPTSIIAESRQKSQAVSFAPDYSALRAMPHVMSTVRNVRASVDLAHDAVSDSVVLNNLHNVSSVDSTTQNNTLALVQEDEEEYDLRFKIGSDVPDSISWDARRRFNISSSKFPDTLTTLAQFPEETEDPNQGSPSSLLMQSAGSGQRESPWATPFWSKLRGGRSRELPRAPIGKLLGLLKESSLDIQSDESFNESAALEGSASSNLSEGCSDVDERFIRVASKYLGLPFTRRKSRGTDSSSQPSTDEPSIAPSTDETSSAPSSALSADEPFAKKKKGKMPKAVRKLGKSLAKKLSQADGSKTVNFKNILRGILSLQAINVDGVPVGRQRLITGRSSSSENSSECGSAVDIDDIKRADPELYATIVETVAEWCEGPTAEPDDKSDQVSTRTFSSISFRERPGASSQDLVNFEMESELAREEAFLADVVEGRIDTRSSSSDSPRKHNETSPSQNAARHGRVGQDQDCCSEMERVMHAIDNLCTPTETADDQPSTSASSNADCPMQSAYLHFFDSDSEEEKEVKGSPNDFLHLTSSEIESLELEGMKEVFKMQGIWIFNWDRCAEIVSLSEKWKKSAALQKYMDGARGFEISMDESTVQCYRYPAPNKQRKKPMEHVFLDGDPPSSTSSTLNLKGTLTTVGLRTTCGFPDGSQREELAWTERDGLCVQVSTELSTGERNVSRVYLKRPLFYSE